MYKRHLLQIAVSVFTIILMGSPAWVIPDTINYQGKLTDPNGVSITGSHILEFYLYTEKQGGSYLWKEQQTIQLTEGIYNVQLGSIEPFPNNLFDNVPLYLEVKIFSSPTGWETLSPRQRLTSTPFAMKAGDASTAGDADANGNVGIGTESPQVSLHNNGYFITKGPWIDVRANNSLSDAVENASGRTLLISNEQKITSDLTIPKNISLVFIRGGKFKISNSVILTINGMIEAGLFQIFTGEGKVNINSGVTDVVYPQWWGMVESVSFGDLGEINTQAIQAALDSGNSPVEITEGIWEFEPTIMLNSHDTIFAKSWKSILKLEDNAKGRAYIQTTGITPGGHNNIILKGFALNGNGDNQDETGNIVAILVWNVKDLLIEGLLLHDLYGVGISLSYGSNGDYNELIIVQSLLNILLRVCLFERF